QAEKEIAGDEAALVGATAGDAIAGAAPAAANDSTPVLAIERVVTRADSEGPGLEEVSLRIARGEIVGVAGVEGNGQRTLVRVLANLVEAQSGRILLGGEDVTRAPLS